MNGESSQTEPKKRSRRFYIILSAAVLLLIIIGVVCVDCVNRTTYGPGPIEIEVTAYKPFYLQGEEVNFTIYVNNPQNWPVAYPTSIIYIIEKDSVYVADLGGGQISWTIPMPTFSPHSKTLFQPFFMP